MNIGISYANENGPTHVLIGFIVILCHNLKQVIVLPLHPELAEVSHL